MGGGVRMKMARDIVTVVMYVAVMGFIGCAVGMGLTLGLFML